MLLRDGQFARKLTCEFCGVGLTHKRTGRIRKYCSDRCRDAARRERQFASFVGAFGPTHTEIARTHETTEKSSTNSMTCKTEKSGRGSPVNLFGGGSFVFPDAIKVDPVLRRKIVLAAFGAYPVRPSNERESGNSGDIQ
jgi:hypothetical protein